MDRRSFLSAISAFAATAALDPERLLWTKSKTIFVPPAPKIERYYGIIAGPEVVEIQRRYNACLSAYAEVMEQSLVDLQFVEGYVWPVETISRREFRRRYPDSKLSV